MPKKKSEKATKPVTKHAERVNIIHNVYSYEYTTKQEVKKDAVSTDKNTD